MTAAHDDGFIPVMPAAALVENVPVAVTIAGIGVLLVRHVDVVHALRNECSHQAQPLAGGRVRRGQIMCPLHGARFDLRTGAACGPPAPRGIAVFPARDQAGTIAICIGGAASQADQDPGGRPGCTEEER